MNIIPIIFQLLLAFFFFFVIFIRCQYIEKTIGVEIDPFKLIDIVAFFFFVFFF